MRRNGNPPASPRLLTRLVALATLAGFLIAQPWATCLPSCLMLGHSQWHKDVAVASAHHHSAVASCHTGKLVSAQAPATGSVGIMLPASWTPELQSPPVVTVARAAPAGAHSGQVPSTEPPPPRAA